MRERNNGEKKTESRGGEEMEAGSRDSGRTGAGKAEAGKRQKAQACRTRQRTSEENDEILWESCRRLTPDQERKEHALERIRREAEQREARYTPSLGELFMIQLQYISVPFWILQGGFVIALAALVEELPGDRAGLADYLQWTSIIAAWMGVAGCSQLGRHFSRGMAELEQSCYFNLTQVWAIRMALSGLADILVLALCSGRIAQRARASFGAVCLYVLVPFVLANVCCMLFFTALRGGRNRYAQLAMAFVAGLMAAAPAATPAEVYDESRLWMWAMVLTVGAGIYLWQLRCMYGKIKRGEMVCWS